MASQLVTGSLHATHHKQPMNARKHVGIPNSRVSKYRTARGTLCIRGIESFDNRRFFEMSTQLTTLFVTRHSEIHPSYDV